MSIVLCCSRKDFHIVSPSVRRNFVKTLTKAITPSFLIKLFANESECNVLLVLKT